MVNLKRDLFSGVFALFFGIFILLVSFTIGKTRLAGVGPDYLPKAVAVYIIGLSVIHLVSILVNKLIRKAETPEETKKSGGAEIELKTLLLTIFLLIAYVFLLRPVGFIVMSAIFLFGQMYILAPAGHRNLLLFIILSVVIPVSVYVLFVNFFNLLLPAGILG